MYLISRIIVELPVRGVGEGAGDRFSEPLFWRRLFPLVCFCCLPFSLALPFFALFPVFLSSDPPSAPSPFNAVSFMSFRHSAPPTRYFHYRFSTPLTPRPYPSSVSSSLAPLSFTSPLLPSLTIIPPPPAASHPPLPPPLFNPLTPTSLPPPTPLPLPRHPSD